MFSLFNFLLLSPPLFSCSICSLLSFFLFFYHLCFPFLSFSFQFLFHLFPSSLLLLPLLFLTLLLFFPFSNLSLPSYLFSYPFLNFSAFLPPSTILLFSSTFYSSMLFNPSSLAFIPSAFLISYFSCFLSSSFHSYLLLIHLLLLFCFSSFLISLLPHLFLLFFLHFPTPITLFSSAFSSFLPFFSYFSALLPFNLFLSFAPLYLFFIFLPLLLAFLLLFFLSLSYPSFSPTSHSSHSFLPFPSLLPLLHPLLFLFAPSSTCSPLHSSPHSACSPFLPLLLISFLFFLLPLLPLFFLNPFLSSVLFRLFPFLLFPSLTYFNPSCSSFHFIHFVSFNSFLSSILSNPHAISFSSALFLNFLPF